MHSGGGGSWAAGKRAAETYGTDELTLLFADVGGDSLHPHTGEDDDVYRFVAEGAANIGGQLVRVAEGRTVWEVFGDERMIGNTRLSVCSRALKQRPVHAWLAANAPDDAVVVVGIDWSEEHRLPAMERAYAPRRVWAPLCEPPLLDREQVLAWMRSEGLEPPAMYARGYSHANCGGFCVRAGQGQFLHLLADNPARYRFHEKQELELRHKLGKDVAVLRDRTMAGRLRAIGLTEADVEWRELPVAGDLDDPPTERRLVHRDTDTDLTDQLPSLVPLTLLELRRRAEGDEAVDRHDIGGCGCFVDDEGDPS